MQEFLSTIFGVAMMFLPGFLGLGNSFGTCIEMVLLTRALVIHGIYSRSQLQTPRNRRKEWREIFRKSYVRQEQVSGLRVPLPLPPLPLRHHHRLLPVLLHHRLPPFPRLGNEISVSGISQVSWGLVLFSSPSSFDSVLSLSSSWASSALTPAKGFKDDHHDDILNVVCYVWRWDGRPIGF